MRRAADPAYAWRDYHRIAWRSPNKNLLETTVQRADGARFGHHAIFQDKGDFEIALYAIEIDVDLDPRIQTSIFLSLTRTGAAARARFL